MTWAAFFAAWAVHFVAAASPGPAVFVTARTGVTRGFRTACWLGVGVAFGACFWAMAAYLGLSVLFKALPSVFLAFKIAGGLFLCWIAFQMWRHADQPIDSAAEGARSDGALAAVWLGMTTQFANPKAAVFFGAVFVGLVPPHTAPLWLAALMLVIFGNELFCNVIVARIFSTEVSQRGYARYKARIDRIFGGVIGVLGLKIATT
ncbi:MAG: hypothetical protein RIT52_606 [Pseudomonadota bacterium]